MTISLGNGSLTGFLLIQFLTVIAGLAESKIRNSPFNLSGIERTYYAFFIRRFAAPLACIWALIYCIYFQGFLVGFGYYAASLFIISLIVRLLFWEALSGIYLILAGPALVAGAVLTIMKHPF